MHTLHTTLRVSSLDDSIPFYRALGFEVVGRVPNTEFGNLAMLKLPDEPFVSIELAHDPAGDPVVLGHGFVCFVIHVDDMAGYVQRLQAEGIDPGEIDSPAGPRGPQVARLVDPDGYLVELVQWPPGHPEGMTAADFARFA